MEQTVATTEYYQRVERIRAALRDLLEEIPRVLGSANARSARYVIAKMNAARAALKEMEVKP